MNLVVKKKKFKFNEGEKEKIYEPIKNFILAEYNKNKDK
jgi:hypothetical protein